jgi:cytochrome c-type biogenesis protein CcmE
VDVSHEPAPAVDLSPRQPAPEPASAKHRRRKWAPILVLLAVVIAGAFVVVKFLGNALDYYCNVDEVGVKKSCSGDRSMRVQGTVERGSVVESATETRFVIAFNGRTLPVTYRGEVNGKFQECIPVIVRGHLDGATLRGNLVEVKHSNDYLAKNADRVATAESGPCPEGSAA